MQIAVKNFLVTGAASGMGLATAEKLLAGHVQIGVVNANGNRVRHGFARGGLANSQIFVSSLGSGEPDVWNTPAFIFLQSVDISKRSALASADAMAGIDFSLHLRTSFEIKTLV